jgi:hypothetical protein
VSACGCGAVCANTQRLIVPGRSASLDWDGLYARFAQPSCYELDAPQRGDSVTAKACWNETSDGTQSICASVDFAYAIERDVTIRAEHHSAQRSPIRVVIDNQSIAPITIATDVCGAQDWFRLALPGDERAAINAFCACACNPDFEASACPTCGPCAEPVFATVEGGTQSTFEWNGMFWYTYESGCSQPLAMPRGMRVDAEVCFTRAGASTPTCQPVSFVQGENDEVWATVL